MSFRETFEACVATLRAHPRIAVTHAWLGEPATDAEIAETEAIVGPLPAAVRAFYKQHNGAQLRWIDRESASFSAHDERAIVGDYDESVGCDDGADGVIHFVPLERLDNADLFHEDDAERYCAFDDFGDEAVALRRSAPGRPLTTKLAIGYDHNVGWDDCTLEFDDYLALTLAVYGHSRQRVLHLYGKADPGWKFPESALRNAVPRGDAATGRRVQWTDERYLYATLRGTVIDGDDGSATCEDPEKIRILGDLGGVITRIRRETDPVTTLDDTYELARSAPDAFLHALVAMPPVAARGMLASLRPASGGRMHGYRNLPMALTSSVFSAIAVFAPVNDSFVRDVFLTLVRTWLPTTPAGATHEVHDGIFYGAEVLSVLASQLPASEIAPIVALAPLIDEFVARFPRQPTPPLLSAHTDYWRSL